MKTQYLEISRADSKCGQLHWVAACAGKLHVGMCIYRKILEGAVSCSKIQKIPWIHGELRILGAAVKNSRDPFCLRIRQGFQQNPVDYAKNCAVAPMLNASVRTITTVNAGLLPSMRTPYRKSCRRLSMYCVWRISRHSSSIRLTPPNMRVAASRASRAFIPAAM